MSDQQRFTRAIVRLPGLSFVAGLTTAELGIPDYQKAVQQHAAYCRALERCGLTLTRLEADERYPDSTFAEDTAVMIGSIEGGRAMGRRAVLTRPGAPSRAGEVERIAEVLAQFCQDLHSIAEPGTLDGGDVCEAEDDFFIGISERTNEAGARQLSKILASYGYTSSFVDIRAVKNILHLKSGLAYLGDNRVAVIGALVDHAAFRSYELVKVNASEQYAANCVRINERVLVAAGFPEFERTLGELGYETIALEMTEFQKMDGGLSCLSLRF
jgi:dimethylargininase